MADIDIKRTHSLSKDEIRTAAEEIAEKLKDKIQVTYRWHGDRLEFKRKGADGSIDVDDAHVRIQVKLGLMFKPMRGVIESKITEYLDKRLA